MPDRLRRRKIKLHNENPHCYWCGCLTFLPESGKKGTHSPQEATIDHIISRYNPLRFKNDGRTINTVLSCYKCNEERSRQETSQIPIEEKWARSGRKPKILDSAQNNL